MKRDIVTDYYRPLLEQNSFRPVPCPEKFGPAGSCWEISPAVGGGYYWVYARHDLFDIKITIFSFMKTSIWTCVFRRASASGATTPSPARS